jgi:hypothetical protein
MPDESMKALFPSEEIKTVPEIVVSSIYLKHLVSSPLFMKISNSWKTMAPESLLVAKIPFPISSRVLMVLKYPNSARYLE